MSLLFPSNFEHLLRICNFNVMAYMLPLKKQTQKGHDMLLEEKIKTSEEVKKLVKKYGCSQSSILPILKAIQKKYGYVSPFARSEVMRLLNVSHIDVNNVISFHKILDKPQAKYTIRVCRSFSCRSKSKDVIMNLIKRKLKIEVGEVSKNNKVFLQSSGCLGLCHLGPVISINDRVYTQVTPKKVEKLLDMLK